MPFYTGFYALVVIILVGMYEREKNAWNNVKLALAIFWVSHQARLAMEP